MPKIIFDKESNIASIKVNNKKSVDSQVHNNVVVDYDKNGNVVNIDIMDISINDFQPLIKNKDRILNSISVKS